MARTHAIANTPADVISIINGAGITDTSLWYYTPRQNLTETHTHTYTDFGVVSTEDISTIATNNNLSNYQLLEWTTSNCKYMIWQTTTITITENYTYDVFYWTP